VVGNGCPLPPRARRLEPKPSPVSTHPCKADGEAMRIPSPCRGQGIAQKCETPLTPLRVVRYRACLRPSTVLGRRLTGSKQEVNGRVAQHRFTV
jgi:hypothetical protein